MKPEKGFHTVVKDFDSVSSLLEWSQTQNSVTLSVKVPHGTASRDVSVTVDGSLVSIKVAGNVLLNQHLIGEVKSQTDWIPWQLEETEKGKFLVVELEKRESSGWSNLLRIDEKENENEKDSGLMETHEEMMQEQTVVEDVTDEETMELFLHKFQQKDLASQDDWNNMAFDKEDISGIPVTEDNVAKVVETYRLAVTNHGSGMAAFHLGRLVHFGICMEKDYKEALYWYQKAAELGCHPLETLLVFNLGLLYSEGGYGIEQRLDKAVELWQVGADSGNPYAMYNLGVMYLNGSGCEQNITKALLLLKAANALDPSLVIPDLSLFEDTFASSSVKSTPKKHKKLSEEDRQRIYGEFKSFAKYCAWTTVGIFAVGLTWKLCRHWLNNRL